MKSVMFVPVYNQVLEFPKVLAELKAEKLPVDTVLLVNNGSSDGSETLVRESGFPYLDLPVNLGIGHSFIKAVEWAIANGFDIVGSMASNGKMIASEMHRVVDPITSGQFDYVTGSRYMSGGDSPNLPSFRKHAIPMVNYFVKMLYGASLTDATCGYRAMKVDIFQRAKFDWRAKWLDTYGFEYYVYGKVIRDKTIRWTEVPITMRYPPKGMRYSKIKPFKGWYEMLKPWVIARMERGGFAPAISTANAQDEQVRATVNKTKV